MNIMRDTEVRLTDAMLRHTLDAWGWTKTDGKSNEELVHMFAVMVECAEHEESGPGEPLCFDTGEMQYQYPLPADGLQHRFWSPTTNEWVCFAPGYPAWETMVGA
jgi:hypothetical protein